MKIFENISLKKYNSFQLKVKAKKLIEIESAEDLKLINSEVYEDNYLVLGEGTNTLFCGDYLGTILVNKILDETIHEDLNFYYVSFGAGVNWDYAVRFCLSKGIKGLENLALIPGVCGAAPIQNIGAYGIEFKDFCECVDYFDVEEQKLQRIYKSDCEFGYRDSIFKRSLKNAIITKVHLKIPKEWKPSINYNGLNTLGNNVTANEIYTKVVEIRKLKLPNYHVLGNGGSFFKNPVITRKRLANLQSLNVNIPFYDVDEFYVKIPAAWLIEHSNANKLSVGGACVYEKHALIIINKSNANWFDIFQLARDIKEKVEVFYNISLENEVRFITTKGEIDLNNENVQF
ncbi:UDP-N-acetylmuramate dehydrogenase [Paraphotobacterium marinum]|uniref:UDP-N-acetylmuramate dehydrogenase n=1 Tax=Paraphotobacterium marinum TaxID=1755811 RepID=UPI0039EBC337